MGIFVGRVRSMCGGSSLGALIFEILTTNAKLQA